MQPKTQLAVAAAAAAAAVVAVFTASLLAGVPAVADGISPVVSCQDGSAQTSQDTPTSGAVTCSTADNSAIDSYTVVTGPAHAAAAGFSFDSATGSFDYLPAAGWHGVDSFVFTASAAGVTSAEARVTLAVDDQAPSCEAISVQRVALGGSLAVTPTCTDPDGDPVSVTVTAAPLHGTVSSDGTTLHYVADPAYAGADSFTFAATDGAVPGLAQTVPVDVNAPPSCADLTGRTRHDSTVTLHPSCTDPDADPIALAVPAPPDHGTVRVASDGTLVYAPAAGYVGTDTVTFVPSDGLDSGAPATATITVSDRRPTVVVAAAATTRQEVRLPVRTHDGDGDRVRLIVVHGPKHGSLDIRGNTLTYRPALRFTGDDRFTLRASDGIETSSPHTVLIHVLPALPAVNRVTVAQQQVLLRLACLRTVHDCAGTATAQLRVRHRQASATGVFFVPAGSTGSCGIYLDTQVQAVLARSGAATLPVTVTLRTTNSVGSSVRVRQTLQGRRAGNG